MTNGTRTIAATKDSPKLPASRSPSANRHDLLREHELARVRGDVVDRTVDVELGRPADRRLDVSRHRLAVRDLFEARLVRLLERNEANPRAGSRPLDHALREVEDRDLAGAAEIENVANGRIAVEEGEERTHGVVHVAEAAALRAVVVDGQILARQRLLDETREDHPVLACLTRADGVEEPDDDAVETGLRVTEREDLAKRLRGRVAPARGGRRPENSLRVFPQRSAAILAVDLRGRGVEQLLVELRGSRDDNVAATHVAQEALDRTVDDQLYADGGSKVNAGVRRSHELTEERCVGDGSVDECDQARVKGVVEVLEPAGAEIVDDDDFFTVLGQHIDQVRADEASSTCNQVFHLLLRSGPLGGKRVRGARESNWAVGLLFLT